VLFKATSQIASTEHSLTFHTRCNFCYLLVSSFQVKHPHRPCGCLCMCKRKHRLINYGYCQALLHLTGSCQNNVRVMVSQVLVNKTGSCQNSIDVDRYTFTLQCQPTVLYMCMYDVIAMKPMHRLQIRPIEHN